MSPAGVYFAQAIWPVCSVAVDCAKWYFVQPCFNRIVLFCWNTYPEIMLIFFCFCYHKFCAQHHCRFCGRIFCGKCCEADLTSTRQGFVDPVRLCQACTPTVKKDNEFMSKQLPILTAGELPTKHHQVHRAVNTDFNSDCF